MKVSFFNFLFIAIIGCNQKQVNIESSLVKSIIQDTIPELYCFKKEVNKDYTTIWLEIKNDSVKGEMDWQPNEKDGATGDLIGLRNKEGELILTYNYTIEGNHQSETMVMKVENDYLIIKNGELIDPNNDEKLKYKDLKNAKFSDTFQRIQCP